MPRMLRRSTLLAAVAALAYLAMGACGSSNNNATPDAGGTPDAGTSTVQVKLASLDFAQETGATAPAQTPLPYGAGLLAVDTATGKVGGFMITSGLVSPTVAHVHDSSGRGVAGGVIIPLTKATIRTLTTGELTLWIIPDNAPAITAAQVADFQAGKLYYNAHTTANPNGEIRGQLDHQGTIKLASMDGSQEQGVTSSASGGGIAAVDTTGGVAGFIITSGLVQQTQAHIHDGPRGAAAPIIVPLTGATVANPTDSDLWVVPDNATINATQVADFTAGNLYYNAHTQAHPSGEIRGQLEKAGTLKVASLDNAQETGATASSALGAGVAVVDDSGEVGGFIVTAGLTAPTLAHIHDSSGRGVAGGVIVPLTFSTAQTPNIGVVPDSAAKITATQVTDYAAGKLYYNAHTTANPGGEIRGQLDHP